MTITTRPAGPGDLDAIADLMLRDAERRRAEDPVLWALSAAPRAALASSLATTLAGGDTTPIRHRYILAETQDRVVGVAHSILLPVPPIYAGENGPPGLLMEDSCRAADAPEGTAQILIAAAEADLEQAGARIVLGSATAGSAMEADYLARGYAPLTLYLAKTALEDASAAPGARPATQDDIAGIVTASARNRATLNALDPFWKPHPQADARFSAWMSESLTLPDRDMFTAHDGRALSGYAKSQPATSLHIPAAHDVGAIGIIDDYYDAEFADPANQSMGHADALLAAAEASRAARGNTAVLVVCPAAWRSKTAVLRKAGYRDALTWLIKR